MQIIIKGMLIISIAAFSLSAAYQAPLYRSMVDTQLAVDNKLTGSIRMAF